jgi:hypothetical protein
MAGGWQHVLSPWASSVHNGAVTVSLFVHIPAVNSPVNLVTSKRSDPNTQDAEKAFLG